jgi:hypothetical protein
MIHSKVANYEWLGIWFTLSPELPELSEINNGKWVSAFGMISRADDVCREQGGATGKRAKIL